MERGSRCLVLITVGLGLICVLLLVFIILQHNTIRAERDLMKSYKNTVEELQDNYTDLMTENDQLHSNFSSCSHKYMELETRVKGLTAEKNQLQGNINSLSQKILELEDKVKDLTAEKSKVTSLSDELKKGSDGLFMSNDAKSWSDSRQYCRDRGADLVIINTEEKQRHISSLVKERVWIGLSDIENEGNMKWVDNSPLNQGFWLKGEPNDQGGTEDCIELMPSNPVLNNWNDLPCSEKKEFICEK
ncbi:CD209 antigen-like protein C [Carassius carassius]|uniref:CD209 antigen-like protein C n=1 Tax=Carassius carassius TaxID=217509 RepID=UPI002868891C|nr:CD209 antigen-like protein C [Carassius carassius]